MHQRTVKGSSCGAVLVEFRLNTTFNGLYSTFIIPVISANSLLIVVIASTSQQIASTISPCQSYFGLPAVRDVHNPCNPYKPIQYIQYITKPRLAHPPSHVFVFPSLSLSFSRKWVPRALGVTAITERSERMSKYIHGLAVIYHALHPCRSTTFIHYH